MTAFLVAGAVVAFLAAAIIIGGGGRARGHSKADQPDEIFTRDGFARAYEGQKFLILDKHRGWYDFLVNNVVPVVPPATIVVWLQPKHIRESCRGRQLDQALGELDFPKARPLSLAVVGGELRFVALDESLEPLRHHARTSPEVQSRVQEILVRAQTGA